MIQNARPSWQRRGFFFDRAQGLDGALSEGNRPESARAGNAAKVWMKNAKAGKLPLTDRGLLFRNAIPVQQQKQCGHLAHPLCPAPKPCPKATPWHAEEKHLPVKRKKEADACPRRKRANPLRGTAQEWDQITQPRRTRCGTCAALSWDRSSQQ